MWSNNVLLPTKCSRRDAARARRFQAPLANIKHDLFLGPKNYKKLALFYYTHTHHSHVGRNGARE